MAKKKSAGSAYVKIYADSSQLTRGLSKAKAKLQAFSKSVGAVGASMAGIGTAISAGLVATAASFANVGDKLDKMSQRTGLSTKWLQKLDYVASQTGSSLNTVESSVAKMQKSLGAAARGAKAKTEMLELMGIAYKDIAMLEPEEQFETIGKAIAKLPTATQRAAAAMELFGEAGRQLLPMFKSGEEGMQALMDQAVKLGLVLSDEDIASAAALTDAWDRLGRTFEAVGIKIGASVAPYLEQISEEASKLLAKISNWIGENRELVVTVGAVGAALAAAGSALLGLSSVIAVVGAGVAGLSAIITAVSSAIAMIGVPVAAAVAGLALLTAAFVSAMASSKDVQKAFVALKETAIANFEEIGATFLRTIKGVSSAIKNGEMEMAWEIGMEGIKLTTLKVLNEVARMLYKTRDIFKQVAGEMLINTTPVIKALNFIGVKTDESVKGFTSMMVELSNELEQLVTGSRDVDLFNTYPTEQKIENLMIKLGEVEEKAKAIKDAKTVKAASSDRTKEALATNAANEKERLKLEAAAKVKAKKKEQERLLAIEKEFAAKREALRKEYAKQDKQERRDGEDSNLRKDQQEELKRLEEQQASDKQSLEERHRAEKKRLEERFEEKYGVSSQGNIKQVVSKEKRTAIKQRAFSIQGARQANERAELVKSQPAARDELLNKQSQDRHNVEDTRYASDLKAQNRENAYAELEKQKQAAIGVATPAQPAETVVATIAASLQTIADKITGGQAVAGTSAVEAQSTTAGDAVKTQDESIWQKNILEIEKTLKEHTRIFRDIEVNTGMLTAEGI